MAWLPFIVVYHFLHFVFLLCFFFVCCLSAFLHCVPRPVRLFYHWSNDMQIFHRWARQLEFINNVTSFLCAVCIFHGIWIYTNQLFGFPFSFTISFSYSNVSGKLELFTSGICHFLLSFFCLLYFELYAKMSARLFSVVIASQSLIICFFFFIKQRAFGFCVLCSQLCCFCFCFKLWQQQKSI